MNKELDEKLVRDFPKIFAQRNLPMTETCMYWGFECGNGWFWLIDNLCGCIQRYIDNNEKEQIEAVQVKEKFGTLRFYVNSYDDIVSGMIWLAEAMSAKICENCGSTVGIKSSTGWIRYLCPECMEGYKKE